MSIKNNKKHSFNTSENSTKNYHNIIKKTIAGLFSFLFLITSIAGVFLTTAPTAFAENSIEQKLTDASKEYFKSEDDSTETESLWGKMQYYHDDSERDNGSFSQVMKRLVSINYMNNTSEGIAGKNQPSLDYICNTNDKNAGTPLYHNCDIPNIMTEVTQDALSMITTTGAINAEQTKAKTPFGMGIPTNLPEGGASIEPQKRNAKYTGLELYGYNLKFTTYAGEYDHIKVMTSARALSNFGFIEDMTLATQTTAKGIAGGLKTSAMRFADDITSGDVFGAFGSMYGNIVEGTVSTAITVILDTSDLNVHNTNAWYRVGYGDTLYNARELTGEEIAARAKSQMITMLQNGSPEDVEVPEDLQKIEKMPTMPKNDISKCVFVDGNGKKNQFGDSKNSPGISEEDCRIASQKALDTREAKGISTPNDNSDIEWSIDGSQKKERIEDWKKRNKEFFDTASKYSIPCSISNDESKRTESITSFQVCWTEAWAEATVKAIQDNQEIENSEWIKDKLSDEKVQEWINEDPTRNFSAPWNRFVCTDSNGKDIIDNNALVMLYDAQGNLNSQCNQVRAPIQNGYFGNGYLPNTNAPMQDVQVDTRNKFLNTNPISTIIPLDRILSSVGSFGMSVSSMIVMFSNTIMQISFSPVLDDLKITEMIADVIIALRESLFFPLIVVVVAIFGLNVIYNLLRNGEIRKQFTSIVLLAVTIISGVFLMSRPRQTINFLDQFPSQIASAIGSTVFSLGNGLNDNICSATHTVDSEAPVGLDGKRLNYSPKENIRILMCENWRTFAFNPWVYGQFGTSYENLYSKESGYPNTLQNKNGSLVGDASVYMGNNTVEKNWALYQLDVTTLGTASFDDFSTSSNIIDRNFYKVIDAQAGPNNGALSDGRYFEVWSGQQGSFRALIGIGNIVISSIGAFAVITYSISSIIIKFIIIILLGLMPFFFLIGAISESGRRKLTNYLLTFGGLIMQYIVLVFFMSVMFRIMVSFGSASNNYLINGIASMLVCLFFIKIRKKLISKAFTSVSSSVGRPIGQQFMNDPEAWIKEKKEQAVGGSIIGNRLARFRTGASGLISGATAGFAHDGIKGVGQIRSFKQFKDSSVYNNATESMKANMDTVTRRQRSKGFSRTESMIQASKAGKKAGQDELYNTYYGQKALRDIQKETKEYKKYEKELEKYNNIENEVMVDGVTYKLDDNQEIIEKPKEPTIDMKSDIEFSRVVKKLAENQKNIDDIKIESTRKHSSNQEISKERSERKFDDFKNGNFNPVHEVQKNKVLNQEIRKNETQDEKIISMNEETLEKERDNLAKRKASIIEKVDRRYEESEQEKLLRDLIKRARNVNNGTINNSST